MKTRKVISAVLAGACAVSALGVSVAAASKDPEYKEVTNASTVSYSFDAPVATPEINVQLPLDTTLAAVVNPYGSAINYNGQSYNSGIMSANGVIRNFTLNTKIDVKVFALAGTADGGNTVTIVAAPVTDGHTGATKKAYAAITGKYASAAIAWDKNLSAETATAASTAGTDVVAKDLNTASKSIGGSVDDAGSPTITTRTWNTLYTLPAAEGELNSKGVATYSKYGYGTVAITGSVSGDPDEWDSATDALKFSVEFKLAPAAT